MRLFQHYSPRDLSGQPYTPIRNYSWITSEGRAGLANQFDCDPSEVEYRLDARAAMDASCAERMEHEDPFSHRRQGARPLTYAEMVF